MSKNQSLLPSQIDLPASGKSIHSQIMTMASLHYGAGADLALDTHSALVHSDHNWLYSVKLAEIVLRTKAAEQHDLIGYELRIQAGLMANGHNLNERLRCQRQKFIENGLIINDKAVDIIDVKKRSYRRSLDNLVALKPIAWLRECVAAADYKI